MDARASLLERLRQRDVRALPELLTGVGHELVAVAYAVLQDEESALRSAASAVATCWRAPAAEWPVDARHVREGLLGEAARTALALHGVTRQVDPLSRPAAGELLSLTPGQRAVVALRHVGHLEPSAAAEALQLGSRARRAAATLLDGGSGDGARARDAVLANVAGLPMGPDAASVLAAIDAPPDAPPRPWRRYLVAAAATATAGLLLVMLIAAPPVDDAALPPASRAPISEPSRPPVAVSVPAIEVRDLADEPSLSDCGIQPPDAELAYAGWTTPEQLGATFAMLGSSQPVYVQVPREPVTWDPRGDAAAGSLRSERLACLTDTTRRLHVVARLPAGWSVPELIDGCPASPMGRSAGLLEIGGPGAFVVLSDGGTGWWADDPNVRLLARLAPSPLSDETVTAWTQPLGPGSPRQLAIEAPPPPERAQRGSTYYLWLASVRFTSPGCWVVSLAVDGELVGSAIIPVSERTSASR